MLFYATICNYIKCNIFPHFFSTLGTVVALYQGEKRVSFSKLYSEDPEESLCN